jgi:hypothetical protein
LFWYKKSGGTPTGTKHMKIEGPVTVGYINRNFISDFIGDVNAGI